MDIAVAFYSMFLLAFGLSALGLGIFTSYFGAGKSRVIGVILTLIGVLVIGAFYIMTMDHWVCEDVKDSFLGVIGITLGAALSMGLIVGFMMLIKEEETEIPDVENPEKELKPAGDETKEDKNEEEKPSGEEEIKESTGNQPEQEEIPGISSKEEGTVPEGAEEPVGEYEPVGGLAGDSPEEIPDDEMSEYLREKEKKKIVKEDWEKVEEEKEEISEEEVREQKDPDIENTEEENEEANESQPEIIEEKISEDIDEEKTEEVEEEKTEEMDETEEKKEGDQ